MTGRRIVIAGAHGFMGTRFAELYRAEGDSVVTVGRRDADAVWGDTAAITRLVDGADLLVNLAGKSVNCRYTERNKAEIFRSRLETTAELGRAVAAADAPPPVWFNASTATIYRHADDRPQTEEDGETRARVLGRRRDLVGAHLLRRGARRRPPGRAAHRHHPGRRLGAHAAGRARPGSGWAARSSAGRATGRG